VTSPQLIVIGGGVRSGKSAFALTLAQQLGTRRVFIATAQAFDDEMRARIAAHRNERADAYETIEEPLALAALLPRVEADVVVIDCLTLWLSNHLLLNESIADVQREVDVLIEELRARRCHTIIVTNEVGMGVVPESALGRMFRDLAGRAHQALSREADQIYFAMLGTLLRIRPEPITAQFGVTPHV
jgi:adenosylcobinamide kinase / adenosylcobinamide-phosphate guanylyltransferase